MLDMSTSSSISKQPTAESNSGSWQNTARVAANLLSALIQPFTPYFANMLGGVDIASRSDASSSLFTPPDFVFAIWGPIFIAMVVYAIHQALPRNRTDLRLRRIGWFTAAAMALNIAWMMVATLVGLGITALIIIFAMLAVLMIAFFGLYTDGQPTKRDYGSIVFPVSIFAAWITVACIAGTASWLRNEAGFTGAGISEGIWVAAMALVGSSLAVTLMVRNRGNIFFALVFVWALSGIAFNCFGQGEMIATSGAIAAIIVVMIGYAYVYRIKRLRS